MTYDGTVTISDPTCVTELDDMPAGYRGFVRYDHSPDSPREWDCVAVLVQVSDRFLPADTGAEVDALREAWGRWRDHDTVERYARIYLGALAYDSWDDSRSSSRVSGIVTRETLAAAGFGPDHAPDAAAILAAELDVYRQWAEGQVYVVTVTREDDGAEDSLWAVYDDSHDFAYCREVASELVANLSD